MVGGVIVGILRERHTHHIVLGGDGAKIFLRRSPTPPMDEKKVADRPRPLVRQRLELRFAGRVGEKGEEIGAISDDLGMELVWCSWRTS